MPTRRTIYSYRPDDDPVTVANQFGITPQQLLAANPGGTPFSTGQTINIPYQYYQALGTQPRPDPSMPVLLGANASAGVSPNYGLDEGRYNNLAPLLPAPSPAAQPPIGYGPNAAQSFTTPRILPNDSWYRTPQQAASETATLNRIATGTMNPPLSAAAPNTAAGEFYGYERDPETGRSVRVIKNSGFVNELRWDPQARKYVSIARLLKQGKLDLKGNWRKQSKRQRQNDAIARKNQQAQQRQDYTLSNSMISFGATSG